MPISSFRVVAKCAISTNFIRLSGASFGRSCCKEDFGYFVVVVVVSAFPYLEWTRSLSVAVFSAVQYV
jgi:hypothetical protein